MSEQVKAHQQIGPLDQLAQRPTPESAVGPRGALLPREHADVEEDLEVEGAESKLS